ncbi:MSCRAMM family protein [Clostridium thermobutyricum]|uniref:MSCRAMM family protein n=1 Tax=Clostridium thermobutyricum TaxID=29372 RepID=UPI003F527437
MDCTNSKSVLKKLSVALIMFMFLTLTQGYQNSFADNIVSSNTNTVTAEAHFTTEKIRDGFYTSLVVDYKILDRSNIKPGDKIIVKLPDVFKNIKPVYSKEHFSNCTVNGDTITLTFGPNINEGVQGYFTLQMYGDSKVENKSYEATATIGDKVVKASVEGEVVESGGGQSPDMYKVFGSGFPVNNLGEGVIVDRNKPVPYSIVVNRNRKNLGTMTLKDNIPSGMALDKNSLKIYEISPNNDYKDVTNIYLNSGRVSMDYTHLQISFDPGNMYMVNYNTFVTATEDKYNNTATMTDYYGKVQGQAVAILGSGAGAINVYKTVDKENVSNFGDQNITYHIKFDSFGTFLKGTMHIQDKINPKLTDIKVTGTKQFTVKYDSATKTLEAVNDKSTIEPGDNAEITINASFKDVQPGEKITNTAQVNGGDTNTVHTTKSPLIQLSKVGVDNPSHLLSGAEFEVINADNNERVSNIVTEKGNTNTLITSDKPIKFELPYGNYKLVEIKAPNGYALNTNPIDFSVNDNSTIINLTAKDNPTGNIKIVKTNDLKEPLQGAKFNLVKDGKVIKTGETDKEGILEFNNIEVGDYKIVEVSAPKGYEISKDTSVKVTKDQNSLVNIVDKNILGSLNITKIGNDGEKLSGAEFTVEGPNGFKKVITTNEAGVATLNNLSWGTYTIKETKAPIGYELSGEAQSITINADNVSNTQNLTFSDKKILGNLVITKEGSDKEKLAGATFEITGPNNFNKTVVTGKDGTVSIDGLAWGSYEVKEIKAPQGYNLDKAPQTVEINSSNVKSIQNLIFKDSKILGNLNITKIGNDGEKLSGAEFTVEGPNGFKKVVTTNEVGVANLNNLSWGTYTIKETKAPIGYELSGKQQTITIDANNVSNVQNLTFNDTKILGNLVITKTDEEGNTLSGAEFMVTGPNGFKKEITTDSKGIASLDNIEWGAYKVQEIKAPEGYNLNSVAQTVEVSKFTVGQSQKLIFKDSKILGSLAITKIGNDGEKLSGAEFTVEGPNGFNKVVTTNKDGVANLNNLSWGTYTIKETKAPIGYELSEKQQTVTIDANNVSNVQNLTFSDKKILGNLVITKTDEEGNVLSGAEFMVTGPNGFKKEITTDSKGIASLDNIEWGTYKVQEIKAPEGYNLNSVAQTVEVSKFTVGQPQKLIFKDKKILGSLVITKEGSDKEKLSGATFEITGPNDFNKTVVTGKDGIVSIDGLAWGSYEVKEIKAPQGYNLDKASQTVEINSSNVKAIQNLVFKDSKKTGTLNITKIGNDGAKLSGAEFTVEGPNGFNKVVTTNEDGVSNLNNLSWGTYTIKETKAPIGYELNGKEQAITINADNVSNTQNLTFSDKKILGNLVITKTDEEGNVLSGAEFMVTGPNGFKKEIITDSKGIASLDNIEWGTYKVQEIKAPEGYNLNSVAQTVEVSKFTVGQPQKLIFKDKKILGSLVITKEGPDKEKLAGATFEITGPNNFNKTVVTGKDGTVSIDGLAWGSYEVKEIKAPQGYNLDKAPQIVEINSSNVKSIQSLIFKDSKKTGTLNITKIGNDGAKLSGAEFIIEGPNGYKQIVTTDKVGVATLNNIPWGTYTIKETKAPIGYELSEKQQTITINADNVSNVQNLTFNDTKILGNLVITKTDEEGNVLSGAKFMVTGPNDFKKEITTDSKGIVSLDNLEWGTYKVQEIKAPEGYNLNSVAQTVEVSKFTVGQPQKLIFKDSKILGSLAITKIGNDGEKLSGAEFTVEGPNGFNKVVTTNKDGVANLNNLSWGTYTIKETKAPEGYNLNNEVKVIKIDSKNAGEVQRVIVKDDKIIEPIVPKEDNKVNEDIPKGNNPIDNSSNNTSSINNENNTSSNSKLDNNKLNTNKPDTNNSNTNDKLNKKSQDYKENNPRNNNPLTGESGQMVVVLVILVAAIILLILNNTKFKKRKN